MEKATTQDPNYSFSLRIDEMRRECGVYGPARLLHNLFLDFFMSLFKLFANLAEQRRNGMLPEIVAPKEPYAWPPLRQRESGW